MSFSQAARAADDGQMMVIQAVQPVRFPYSAAWKTAFLNECASRA